MTAVPLGAAPTPTTPVRGLVRQLLRDSGYVLFSLPLALVGFVLAVAGISLTAGLLVTTLGLPVLTGTLYAARGLADLERLRLPAVLRQPRVRPIYLAPSGARASGGGFSPRCATRSPGSTCCTPSSGCW